MAVLHSELVVSRGWLRPDQYGMTFALARITPGTNLLAFSAGAAWQILGWPAAILAVLAVTLPSAVIVLLLTHGYEVFRSNALAMAAISGTLAAAVGMMATGAFQLIRPQLRSKRRLRALVVVGASLALSLGFSMPPIQVLALAALTGWIWRVPAE